MNCFEGVSAGSPLYRENREYGNNKSQLGKTHRTGNDVHPCCQFLGSEDIGYCDFCLKIFLFFLGTRCFCQVGFTYETVANR